MVERRHGITHRRRIRRIGLDQQHRALAAYQLAAEVLRDGDRELHLAAREQAFQLAFAGDEAIEAVVAAGLHRREQGA